MKTNEKNSDSQVKLFKEYCYTRIKQIFGENILYNIDTYDNINFKGYYAGGSFLSDYYILFTKNANILSIENPIILLKLLNKNEFLKIRNEYIKDYDEYRELEDYEKDVIRDKINDECLKYFQRKYDLSFDYKSYLRKIKLGKILTE